MTTRQKTDKADAFLYFWKILASKAYLLPISEYPFSEKIGRKHRFDYAFVIQKVAVEIEGNAAWVRGGGKHMQDRDLEKYNLAAMLGWRVVRFSPAMLKNDPTGCVEIVLKTLESQ